MIKTDNFEGYTRLNSLISLNRDAFIDAVVKVALSSARDPKAETCYVLGFSSAQLSRYSQAATGESLVFFVRRLRLERAAGRISTSSMAIAEIATEAGYSRVQGFDKAFSNHFGVSPRQFAKTNRGTRHLLPGYRLAHGLPMAKTVPLRRPDGDVSHLHYDGPLILAIGYPGEPIVWGWRPPLTPWVVDSSGISGPRPI